MVQASRREKQKAALSIVGNSLYLLIAGGGLLALLGLALWGITSGTMTVANWLFLIVVLLAVIAWRLRRQR